MDSNSQGDEVSLTKGITIPEFIRKVYRILDIYPLSEEFPFLNRDNEDKTYEPGKADPFVFKNPASMELFKKQALDMIHYLTNVWRAMGLPIKRDKDREIDVPDSDKLLSVIMGESKDDNLKRIYDAHSEDISTILSNIDIALKVCVVRTILPAWWVVSYAGKDSTNLEGFKPAVDLLIDAMLDIIQGPNWKYVYNKTVADQGDPLETTVGFPFYTNTVDKMGNPLSKLMVLEMYKDLIKPGMTWPQVLEAMSSRGATAFQKKHLLAVAPIRRSMYGYKWAHVWDRTIYGYKLRDDVRGYNTTRVAWMAPYILNLLISPIQGEWKALRKLMPGLFHDGEVRREELEGLKRSKHMLIESDFSNYDKSIPNDVMAYFFQEYVRRRGLSPYYLGALSQTHKNLPLVWGDYSGFSRNKGWVFKVPVLGLLSGLKVTSEVGTFTTLIMNIKGWLDTGYMTKDQVKSYLSQYAVDPDWKSKIKSNVPKILIASDDVLLISKTVDEMRMLVNSFRSGTKAAGIASSIFLGDKFLMRHMYSGKDTGVIMRVYQNTISNEDSVIDPIKFLVGLGVRTDGLGGFKTSDPFNTGDYRGCSKLESSLAKMMLTALYNLVSSSSVPLPAAIKFLKDFISLMDNMTETNGRMFANKLAIQGINDQRKLFLNALAAAEILKAKSNTSEFLASYVAMLRRNSSSPSSALILEALLKLHPELNNLVDIAADKESAFYRFAMNKIGLPINASDYK